MKMKYMAEIELSSGANATAILTQPEIDRIILIATDWIDDADLEKLKTKLAAIKDGHGSSSYLTYSITSSDGSDISEEIYRAEGRLMNEW